MYHFRTVAIAWKDVASQIVSNAAGLGKGITASIVATENVFRHESKVVGVDLKHQLLVIHHQIQWNLDFQAKSVYLCIIIHEMLDYFL